MGLIRKDQYEPSDRFIAMQYIYNIRMNSTTYNDKTEKVGITLPNSLIKQTDKARRDIPRSTYIRRAIEYYLKQGKTR
jgi:hypothetical protein